MLSLIWLYTGTIVCFTSFKPKVCVAQQFNYPVEFDQLNLTGLKNSLKTAQKTNVEPDMATYWYNSMLCKFLNPNYAWHNNLPTRLNSTGLKNSLKMAQKQMLSLIWLHTGTIVCCASF